VIDTSPLAILSLRLEGLEGRGLAPPLLHSYMEGYFVGKNIGKLIYREIEFAINSKNINKWADNINKVVEEFERHVETQPYTYLFTERIK
jgi:hypothetical protein